MFFLAQYFDDFLDLFTTETRITPSYTELNELTNLRVSPCSPSFRRSIFLSLSSTFIREIFLTNFYNPVLFWLVQVRDKMFIETKQPAFLKVPLVTKYLLLINI